MNDDQKLKEKILSLVKEYYYLVHHKPNEKFKPIESRINYAGRVFDEEEMINLVDSSLDFWLTSGPYSVRFEAQLARFLGLHYALLVNSGSSANLVAFTTLTSPLLKERRIKPGDEVITVAAGFPTTISPIIQNRAIPVFLDIDLKTANIQTKDLEKAYSPKVKAVMIAHTLGNPFNLKKIRAFCDKYKLWLIEDNCDALGSLYDNKLTGTWGDIGTSSFYPPHHMTMGEGGAVYTNNPLLKRIMASIRDWGRDCWCDSGKDNTCCKRFSWQLGKLPYGYDHKYTYSHFGYNLKVTDMQAAIGLAQIKKLPGFVRQRRKNFTLLKNGLADLHKYFYLPEPTKNSIPSWFGFLITLKKNLPFTRKELVDFLEARNIQTRNLFAGNIIKQPLFNEMIEGKDFRVVGDLKNTDKIMVDSFLVGVYPGMKKKAVEYMIESIHDFVNERTKT